MFICTPYSCIIRNIRNILVAHESCKHAPQPIKVILRHVNTLVGKCPEPEYSVASAHARLTMNPGVSLLLWLLQAGRTTWRTAGRKAARVSIFGVRRRLQSAFNTLSNHFSWFQKLIKKFSRRASNLKESETVRRSLSLTSEMAQRGIQLDSAKFCCSICVDLLKDPVTIPCGHSYCMSCLKRYWDREEQREIPSCPQCRQTIFPSKEQPDAESSEDIYSYENINYCLLLKKNHCSPV
uniref:RING-type domain-containing protein n=1 Tax=Myripristis murdjan TaxID=586833 RepID=A0A668AL01_9TELE